MTTDTGQKKGLQQTLEEQGFNITGMRVKCVLMRTQTAAWLDF